MLLVLTKRYSTHTKTITYIRYKNGVVADGLFHIIRELPERLINGQMFPDTDNYVAWGQYNNGIISWVVFIRLGFPYIFVLYDRAGYIAKIRHENENNNGNTYSLSATQYNGQVLLTYGGNPTEKYYIENGILTGDFAMKAQTLKEESELLKLPISNMEYKVDTGFEPKASIYFTYTGTFMPTKIDSINYLLSPEDYPSKVDIMRGWVTVTASEFQMLISGGYDQILLRKYFINSSGNKDGSETVNVSSDDIGVDGNPVTCDTLAQDKIYCHYGDNKQVLLVVMYWIDGRLVTTEEYATYYENVEQEVNASISDCKIPFGNIVEQYLHH